MTLIIDEHRPRSTSDRFSEAFSGLGSSLAEDIPQHLIGRRKEREEIEAGRRHGLNLQGMPENTRAKAFEQAFKSEAEQKKNLGEQFLENKSYEKIKEAFGEKFADVWKSASAGGKTELLKQGIDARLRGNKVNDLFQGMESPESQESENQENRISQMKDGKVSKEFQWPDFTKRPSGYSPKDWVAEKKTWRKENSPVFLENKTRLQSNKKDEIAIKKLDKLNRSKKLPEGLEKLIIDPETGDIRGVAQLAGLASPETQEWVKETARFQNRAKDAFGSRVTNFDLMSYMKQFPGLLNTTEGRERIINMMKINNELDQLYENSLQKIYQKYGLSGIPQEEADKLAKGEFVL